MYRELISQLSQGLDWVELQPPCSERELMKAEQTVGCTFPAELKDLLREINGDKWCILSAQEIIENVQRNQKYFLPLFEECWSREEYWERIGSFLFFASNGCGDYYGYRISPGGTVVDTTVYYWSHEDIGEPCCWKKAASDLTDFLTRFYHDEI